MRLDRFITLNLVQPVRRTLLDFRSINHRQPTATSAIPVLMYHGISDEPEPGVLPYYKTNTSPAVFRQHLGFLRQNGCHSISLTHLARLLRRGESFPEKTIVITFDDGFRNFYTEAFPLLQEHGFTTTVFLPTAFIGEARRHFSPQNGLPLRIGSRPLPARKGAECLTWAEVQELRDYGIEFGSHTVNHPELVALSWNQIEQELRDSKKHLEAHLDMPITTFAFPYAFPQNDHAFVHSLSKVLAGMGYLSCATTELGVVKPGSDPFRLKRLPMNFLDDVRLLGAKLQGAYDWMAVPQSLFKRLRSRKAACGPRDGRCHHLPGR